MNLREVTVRMTSRLQNRRALGEIMLLCDLGNNAQQLFEHNCQSQFAM